MVPVGNFKELILPEREAAGVKGSGLRAFVAPEYQELSKRGLKMFSH